jgi:RimJ/RimL family protein N-acetyltransferase
MALSRLFYGPRIRLTSPVIGDGRIMAEWYQDSDFSRHLDALPAYPKTETEINRWLDEVSSAKNDFLFIIRPLDSSQTMGFVHLGEILWSHRVAWLAIGVSSEYQGQSYGHEALTLALQFAFDEINLHRVQLTVFDYNTPAIRLYEKLGFKREGVFREFMQRDGHRHDMYLYGLLSSEWPSKI